MFERFTKRAREAVLHARQESRALGQRSIGTEHLVLALLVDNGGVAYTVLHACGLEHDEVLAEVRRLPGVGDDTEALRSIGIDLDAVRARVEETFGEGALDRAPTAGKPGFFGRITGGRPSGTFTPGAKKALELSLRIALSMKHDYIGTEHLLLGILKEERGSGARILRDAGLTFEHARHLVLTALGKAA